MRVWQRPSVEGLADQARNLVGLVPLGPVRSVIEEVDFGAPELSGDVVRDLGGEEGVVCAEDQRDGHLERGQARLGDDVVLSIQGGEQRSGPCSDRVTGVGL